MTNILVDSTLTITNGISAPLFRFGVDEKCNIRIVEENGKKKMLVTLPNNYEGYTRIETYDMRSIIESIQELNRRTATMHTNVGWIPLNGVKNKR